MLLVLQGRLIISPTSVWIPKLIKEFHSLAIIGHSGAFRTYKRISSNLYWPGMMKHIQNFMAECLVCQQQKYEASSPAGLLQPLPIPNQVWEDISLDFVTGLPRSNGFDAILVVVDRYTKYAHFLSPASLHSQICC